MAFEIYIPIPYFNFLTIVVSTAVLLWGARALKRLSRVLSVRNAALNDSLVMIRGLGHSIMNFEGASQIHMNAIIHTRPAKPPSQMNILYLPFVIESTVVKLNTREDGLCVDIKIWVASKTYIMVLSNFKVNYFKQRYPAIKETALNVTNEIARSTDDSNSNMQYVRRNDFTEAMVRLGICQHISQSVALNPGSHMVNLPIFTPTPASRTSLSEETNYAIFILPSPALSSLELSDSMKADGLDKPSPTERKGILSLPGRLASLSPSSPNASRGTLAMTHTNDTSSGIDDAEAGIGSLRDPLAPKPPQLIPNRPDMVKLDFIFHILGNFTPANSAPPEPVASSSSIRKSPRQDPYINVNMSSVFSTPISVSCQEVILSANGGNLYNVYEVYGMKQKSLQKSQPNSNPSPVPSAPFKAGGDYTPVLSMSDKGLAEDDENNQPVSTPSAPLVGESSEAKNEDEEETAEEEECVVCLTEVKSVLLMPCRHMCVCGTCLQHIDKCPVCRTPFDEYITVRAHSALLRAPVCSR